MLKNIDPVLNADVLHALCSMGHGDEVVVVDSHYPAEASARSSVYGKLLRMEACDSGRAIGALLSVFELDGAVSHPAARMQVDNEPQTLPCVQQEVQAAIDKAVGRKLELAPVVRADFYDRAKNSFCVIVTGETRGWGCFIFKKGVILTPDQPATKNNSTLNMWKQGD
ncbi:MAG: RbsD/FucU domain-containing protein [Candidatus Obscuribacterales bacterium]|nr:RbsD/FucU domain-containing protein [Candidatus Obscuribacterales bacterium]